MKTFYLKTKDLETIKSFKCEALENAIEYFSILKQLTPEQVLHVFVVTDKY